MHCEHVVKYQGVTPQCSYLLPFETQINSPALTAVENVPWFWCSNRSIGVNNSNSYSIGTVCFPYIYWKSRNTEIVSQIWSVFTSVSYTWRVPCGGVDPHLNCLCLSVGAAWVSCQRLTEALRMCVCVQGMGGGMMGPSAGGAGFQQQPAPAGGMMAGAGGVPPMQPMVGPAYTTTHPHWGTSIWALTHWIQFVELGKMWPFNQWNTANVCPKSRLND